MKPTCIDPQTKKEVEIGETIPCELLRKQLLALCHMECCEAVELRTKGRGFSIDLHVSAAVKREDGSIDIYGGAGSDEHWGEWCIVVPSNIKKQRSKYVRTTAYFYMHKRQVLVPVHM